LCVVCCALRENVKITDLTYDRKSLGKPIRRTSFKRLDHSPRREYMIGAVLSDPAPAGEDRKHHPNGSGARTHSF
jgi:hypothetical protein